MGISRAPALHTLSLSIEPCQCDVTTHIYSHASNVPECTIWHTEHGNRHELCANHSQDTNSRFHRSYTKAYAILQLTCAKYIHRYCVRILSLSKTHAELVSDMLSSAMSSESPFVIVTIDRRRHKHFPVPPNGTRERGRGSLLFPMKYSERVGTHTNDNHHHLHS